MRRGRKILLKIVIDKIKSVDGPDYCNVLMPLNITTLMPLYNVMLVSLGKGTLSPPIAY